MLWMENGERERDQDFCCCYFAAFTESFTWYAATTHMCTRWTHFTASTYTFGLYNDTLYTDLMHTLTMDDVIKKSKD